MRFALLLILACAFLAAPTMLRPVIGVAALLVIGFEFAAMWQDMRRASQRRNSIGAQIRGYADTYQRGRARRP